MVNKKISTHGTEAVRWNRETFARPGLMYSTHIQYMTVLPVDGCQELLLGLNIVFFAFAKQEVQFQIRRSASISVSSCCTSFWVTVPSALAYALLACL